MGKSSSSSGTGLTGGGGAGANGTKPLPGKASSRITGLGDVVVGRMSMQVKVSERATKQVRSTDKHQPN